MGLYRTSLGYDPHNVIIASITFQRTVTRNGPTAPHSMSAYGIKWQSAPSRIDRARLEQRDTTRVGQRSVVEIPGQDTPGRGTAILQRISADYFATMRLPLIRGRVWSDSESAGTPHVAVVNQTMARELWPDDSAIGRRVRMPEYIRSTSYWRLPAPGSDGWFEIIGVVGDTPMSVSTSGRRLRFTCPTLSC